MKKKILCIILLSTIALTGCRDAQTGNTEGTVTESQSETESESESEPVKKVISEVIVRTEVENAETILDIKDVPNPECFYEDENYEYYFLKPMSEYIFVFYEDGSSERIKEAFARGHVELGDFKYLYKLDIFVKAKNRAEGAEAQLVNIATRSKETDGFVQPATFKETFYREGKYRYYYISKGNPTRSQYIYTYYDDGTRVQMMTDLENGKITIEDLQAFGFGGTKVLDIERVVDLTANGDVACDQQIEEIVEGKKYKYYLTCVKSPYIELHYKNGEKETLRNLIDAGEVTEEMMDEIRHLDIAGLKRERVPSPIEKIQYFCDITPRASDIKEVRTPVLLHEDEKYQYYLEFSGSIMIDYENGIREHDIIGALTKGRVTIQDLGKAGIGCFVCEKNPTEGANPSLFYIVDSKIEDGATNAVFYEDATYAYSISDTNINYIYAYYTNGTREPIAEALKAGRITIADLDANGIEYTKTAK